MPPRAPPRYRPQQQEPAPRSPVNISHVTESDQLQQPSSLHLGPPKPEPHPKRRSPYDSEYKDWKSHVQHDGGPAEQVGNIIERYIGHCFYNLYRAYLIRISRIL